jgi:hypothetical protein
MSDAAPNACLRPPRLDNRPSWLRDEDELPHDLRTSPAWNETYLDYGFSPNNRLGFWVHLRHLPDAERVSGIWDIVMFAMLPDDHFLVARIDAPGRWSHGAEDRGQLEIAGLTWTCETPFSRWRKSLRGAGRVVSGAELRAGPLQAGSLTTFDLDYTYDAITPPWDHETGKTRAPKAETAYSKFHYAQHHRFEATLRVGEQLFRMAGDGLRDHSWGVRDWSKMGNTTWMQGRRPDGECFSLTYTPETPFKPELRDPKVGNADEIFFTSVTDVPLATNIAQALADFSFTLAMPDGRATPVRGRTVASIPMHFFQPSEFVLGAGALYSDATHDYIVKFVELEWDGHTFYGYDDRCVRKLP